MPTDDSQAVEIERLRHEVCNREARIAYLECTLAQLEATTHEAESTETKLMELRRELHEQRSTHEAQQRCLSSILRIAREAVRTAAGHR